MTHHDCLREGWRGRGEGREGERGREREGGRGDIRFFVVQVLTIPEKIKGAGGGNRGS